MNKNNKTLLTIFTVVFVMVGLAFATVPLYKLFCQVTGYGGTTQVASSAPDTILDREVTVLFNTDTGLNLPWDFSAEKNAITLPIGGQSLINFKAENNSDKVITGTAIYNVSPPKAGKYFHKIECFCFQEQVLNPNESVNMPVVFFVDPSFDKDPNMDDITQLTLSYTFFEADTKALEDAMEDFYNSDADDASKIIN